MGNIHIIVAVAENMAIGVDGGLLTHISADLKRFKQLTMGSPIIMGRKTYVSLPRRPLPGRTNIVITSDPNNVIKDGEAVPENLVVVTSIDEALAKADAISDKVYIIGGGRIYAQTLDKADTLDLTWLHYTPQKADTFLPEIDFQQWQLTETSGVIDSDSEVPYEFVTYVRKKNLE